MKSPDNKLKAEKMRYQNNQSAYLLVMLSIVLGVISLFTLITYDEFSTPSIIEGLPLRVIPDFRIAIEIALGIFTLLLSFLAAEKVKVYQRFWSFYGLFILAGVTLYRIIGVPGLVYDAELLIEHKMYSVFYALPYYDFMKGWIPESVKNLALAELWIGFACLVFAAVISIRKVIIIDNNLKELK